jgi:hypothetical protein
MKIYPFSQPIILTRNIFVAYGGQPANFSDDLLTSSFWLAEMQVSNYIGTLLLPAIVTGTYGYAGGNRVATDYGYVQRILGVSVLSQQSSMNCTLDSKSGCAFIFNDTFGYVDWRQLSSICGCGDGLSGYQVQIAYEAGLPTGTANQPTVLEALTIMAQIDLNERFPGQAGLNEGVGDVTIQEFRSLDYAEKRGEHSLIQTALGGSPKAMRAKRLLDLTITKARKTLLIG